MAKAFTLRDTVMHYNLFKRLVATHQQMIEQYEEYAHITQEPGVKEMCQNIVASQKVCQKEILRMMKSCREQIENVSAMIENWNKTNRENGSNEG